MAMPVRTDRWTAEDLEQIPDDGLRYEVLNGQLIVNAAPKPRHQWLIKKLVRALDDAIAADMFVIEGVGVLIGTDEPIPDIVVGYGQVDWESRGIPVDQVLLAIEVVSSSTTMQDRLVKPALYADAGIRHYWRIETLPFKGRLPEEALPVLFAHTLAEAGSYELTHRVPAGRFTTLSAPVRITLDPGALLN